MQKHTNYLLGDASDTENWGDPSLTKGGKWAPLELVVAPKYRANFMFMETVDAVVQSGRMIISLYKHDITREYVNVDDQGRLYRWAGGDRYTELSVEDARDRLVGKLVDMLDEGLDIGRDMSEIWQRLADMTGLSIRTKTPEPKP